MWCLKCIQKGEITELIEKELSKEQKILEMMYLKCPKCDYSFLGTAKSINRIEGEQKKILRKGGRNEIS